MQPAALLAFRAAQRLIASVAGLDQARDAAAAPACTLPRDYGLTSKCRPAHQSVDLPQALHCAGTSGGQAPSLQRPPCTSRRCAAATPRVSAG